MKFTATLMALMAMLALVAGPVQAQETGTDTDDVEVDGDDDGDGLGQVRSAAARARAAAKDLESGDADARLIAGEERATEALQGALDRLSVEGAGGSGVAAEVLTALLEGESPSEIGAAHGAKMAQAAADRRAERSEAGQGRPEDAGRPDSAGAPDDAGTADDAGAGRPEGAGRP